MAESLVSVIAQEIERKLESESILEIGQRWNLKDELERIKLKVSRIQVVLRDAEESFEVKEWLGKLKEILHDAEDMLDELSAEYLRQQLMTGNTMVNEVRRFFLNRVVYDKIKVIGVKLDQLAHGFHLESLSRGRAVKSREHASSYLPEVVIAREDDKEAIIELLLSSLNGGEGNVSVIPIVGIGGLGKTTLAQLLFDDERAKMHFELRIWVWVSDVFDIKLIVEQILGSVSSSSKPIHSDSDSDSDGDSEIDSLKYRLLEKINGRKYLMVLDNVWNESYKKWALLRYLLPCGASGSKIIMTTRFKTAAEMTHPIAIHELRDLSDVESWILFKRVALRAGQVLTQTHESIGKEIVAKCSGVPLAIKAMGRLLFSRDSESDWLHIRGKKLSEIDMQDYDILASLMLSYNHLRSHLKQCFAYCTLFPKGYEIDVEMLIQLWIAQGYVVPSHSYQSLEEIGVAYFTDLLGKLFFQEVKKDVYGNYKTCKMHDLMYDLAMLVAGEECASMSSYEQEFKINKTKHVSFHVDRGAVCELPLFLFREHKLRTFLLLGWGQSNINEAMFSNLGCLRVLDLHEIVTLPSSIDRLKLLRYLDLSQDKSSRSEGNIKTLPDSVTKLQFLQVLKLNGCGELTQLPNDMKKLVNLTHLDNYLCYGLTHMPRGIGQLTSLEKLSEFVLAVDSSFSQLGAGLNELRDLNKLRGMLRIKNLQRVKNAAFECEGANLERKQHLQKLELEWKNPFDSTSASESEVENDEMALEALKPHPDLKGLSVIGYRGVKLPNWLSSLTNLVSICFWGCENIKHLPPFDQLPSLKLLTISCLPYLEYINAGGDQSSLFFPSLEELYFYECPNLKGWNPDKAELLRFPCLSTLTIISCLNLTSMPLSPALKVLRFKSYTAKSLEQILKIMISASESSYSSSSTTCSQLEDLTVWIVEDLAFLPNALLSNLTSIQRLEIRGCLSPDDNDDKEMQCQGLQSLHSLELGDLSCESLPKGFQYATSLHTLKIFRCPNLMSLPEWMFDLSSLKHISIFRCPLLSKRCDNNAAEDWPKIAHVPDISIEKKTIQRNGKYQL